MSVTCGVALAKSAGIQKVMQEHFDAYHRMEHFSGIQVSTRVGDALRHFVIGKVSLEENAQKLRPDHLFNIGSITKSFTGVLALKAQEDKKLSMTKTVGEYLPKYKHWSSIQLTQLLDMSSGLPNYSDSATMNYAFAQDLEKNWGLEEMIALVYKDKYTPPIRTGYDYTNTGYILMEMILNKQCKQRYKALLQEKIITPLGLKNTFYPVPKAEKAMEKRLVSGYGYNVYVNPELVGKDVRKNNLSWGAAAGGIVANSEDVLHWAAALFDEDNDFLTSS